MRPQSIVRIVTPFIIAVTAAFTAAADDRAHRRNDAWQQDLLVARDVFLTKDRSYSAEARRAAWHELERTRARVERLTDQEIVASLARAAALSGNAHTRAYLLRNRSYWRRYPLRIWRFPEGWYVVAARGEAAPLAGGKLTHIGGVPIERVFERVRPLYAGNAGWSDYMATYTLTSPDALLGAGAINNEAADFSVQVGDEARSIRLRAEPLVTRKGPEESWWFLSPRHPAASEWTHVLASSPLPQVLLSPERHYAFASCAHEVLYARFNRAADEPGKETVREFGERLLAAIASRPPSKLVLDLRFNTGGNLQLARPLIEALARSPLGSRRGAIAVLVGPSTFSAGITPAAWLRANSNAVLVGAHPGDRLDYWAEGGNVTLPSSGIDMHYADELHHYSDAPLPSGALGHLHLDIDVRDLEPDIAIEWTWQEYRSGADPVLAAAAGVPLRCTEPAE